MQYENSLCVSKMVVKKYSKNIDTNYTYKQTYHHAWQGNPNNHFHIPRRKSAWPSYPGSNYSVYSSNSTTTFYIIPMHCLKSIYNIQRCSSIRRNFHCPIIIATTYPTSIWADISLVKNLSSKFTCYPSWATNSIYHLIYWSSQQNAIWFHETKRVLIPF